VRNKLVTLSLVAAIVSGNANGSTPYANDNPFVDAMVRMMEEMGLLDRARPPVTVPYMPGAGMSPYPGLGMGYPGFGGMPGMNALGGVPGSTGMPAMGNWPMNPGYAQGMMPGGGNAWGQAPQQWLNNAPVPQNQMQQWLGATTAPQGQLDGAWELNRGGLVVISGNRARFYLSLEQYQDYTIGYDQSHLWWTPANGTTQSRYRYKMQDDRMIIADDQDNYLLLRRR
jgi:hypothetical protein